MTGKIQTKSNSGSGYFKTDDGFLMKWQEAEFANGDYAKTLYWGGEFTQIDTVMLSTGANDVTTSAVINNSNSVNVGRRPATTACTVRCLAIGRWK